MSKLITEYGACTTETGALPGEPEADHLNRHVKGLLGSAALTSSGLGDELATGEVKTKRSRGQSDTSLVSQHIKDIRAANAEPVEEYES